VSDVALPALRERWLQLSGNSRGALWMLASGLVFSVMALAIKLLGQRLDNLQIGFFRVAVGFIAILPFVARAGWSQIRTQHLHVHIIRAVFGLLAMYCSYYAIAHIPLADYTALSFTKPLFATFLAVVILHEVVRWRRWTATAVGFVGVIVMVRPGATAFQPAALAALVEAFSIAFLVTLVKRLPARETTTGMLFHFGLFASVLSIAPAVYAWQWPTAFEWFLLISVGLLGAMAQSCWIRSFRCGDASVVAPFDYLRLLFAGSVGFAVFGELPTVWTLAGAGVIVTSTLYIAHREAQLSRTVRPDGLRR